jgi:hypothetical protein
MTEKISRIIFKEVIAGTDTSDSIEAEVERQRPVKGSLQIQ